MLGKGKYHEWLTDEGLVLLKALARDGYTDEMLAKRIGISTSTFYAWKERFPEFSEALKKGKEVVDIQVENALLKRALGFEYEEVVQEVKIDGLGRKEKRQRVVKKMVPPDTGAAMAWLKNRCPDKWRDQLRQDESKQKDNKEENSVQIYIPDNDRNKKGEA